MNVVIIGGSAHSTPALFDTPHALDAGRFSFTLAGRSATRLAAVRRAIACVAQQRGIAVDCGTTDARPPVAAIAAADVVLVQFRVGGYAARAYDETFPHRYGVCGDEGLGPGGLACAWRTWSELRELLAIVRRVNPRAFVILLTSPIGILTRCARQTFPALALYGICELPWTTLNDICGAAGADAGDASYAYIGVNHIGWFADVRAGGATIVPAARVHPLKYVRLADDAADVLAEQRAAGARGVELAGLADGAFAAYADAPPAAVVAAIRQRGTPWYAHAVAPLLRSLAGDDTGVTYFLSAENAGYCARFAADDIIEMPHTVQDGRLVRSGSAAWRRDDVAARVAALVAYERLAARAVSECDPAAIAAALRIHPWLDGVAEIDALAADVVGSAPAAFATSVR